jgi:RimJ/RimL family protein N-acetyltransferase
MDEILTPRLRLRQAESRDLADIHDLLSHPVGMRYWSTLPHHDIEQSRAWLTGMISHSEQTGCDFVVELEDRVIGKAGCYAPPEIGYIFHPDHWGHGYAAEALAAIIPHVFATHAINALKADVDPRNGPSLKLLAKLGFREVGRASRTWLVGTEWCDSVYMELKRGEI